MKVRALLKASFFFGMCRVANAGSPTLPDVPETLPPAVRAPLIQRRANLLSGRELLKAKIASFNNRCASVEANTAQDQACKVEQGALAAEREAYAKEAPAFKEALARAIAEHPAIPAAPPPPPPPLLTPPAVQPFPAVDPRALYSAEQAAQDRRQVQALQQRKKRLEGVIQRLNAMRGNEDAIAQQLGKLQREVFYDALTDTLSALSNTAALKSLGLSPARAVELARVFKAYQSGVTALAAAESLSIRSGGNDKDVERGLKKVRDLSQAALGALAGMADLPAEQVEVLKGTVRMSYASVKAIEENDKAKAASTRVQLVTFLDGMLSQAAAYNASLRATRAGINAGINVGMGAYVCWRINADKESLRDDLVSAQQGKRLMMDRLQQTDERISFYQIELKKAAATGKRASVGRKE